MIKLDLKDKKILYELDLNSRQSFHDLARKVRISKDSAIYRVERMKKEGIIQGFHTIIDTAKLGFLSFRLYLKFQNTTPQKEEEIINWCKNQKQITWLVSIEGEYDLGMWCLVKDQREMSKLWKNLLQKYVNFIEKRWLTLFSKVTYFPRSYLLDKEKNSEEFIFISDSEQIKLDSKEIQILKMLSEDARTSIVELSAKIKSTPKTIIKRIRELEDKKVILGYRGFFDIKKLGYDYFKLFISLHNLNSKKEEEFRNFIKQNTNIIYDNEVLGGEDIELDIQLKSLDELRILIEEIKKKFADIIKSHKSLIFYKEHKYVFFPDN